MESQTQPGDLAQQEKKIGDLAQQEKKIGDLAQQETEVCDLAQRESQPGELAQPTQPADHAQEATLLDAPAAESPEETPIAPPGSNNSSAMKSTVPVEGKGVAPAESEAEPSSTTPVANEKRPPTRRATWQT